MWDDPGIPIIEFKDKVIYPELELELELCNGSNKVWSYNQTSKDLNNNDDGFYLLNFNILYKNKKTVCLTYSSLWYNTLFIKPLMYYF